MKEDYNIDDYKVDFPDEGTWNWKVIELTNADNSYYQGHKTTGVLLHDGNFMINGVMFEKHEFIVIDHDPMNMKIGPTLEEFLLKNSNIMKGEIEFRLVINKISGDEDGKSSVRIYCHPLGRDGDTLDADIEGNNFMIIEGDLE